MKAGLFKSDWLVGLMVTIAILVFASTTNFIDGLERAAYDFGVRSSIRAPSSKVAVIAIDDESIANIGRWPWSRDIHAQMHAILTEGGAKVIGQTVFFLEPQLDPGLQNIRSLKQAFMTSNLQNIPDQVNEYLIELETVVDATQALVKGKRDKNGRRAVKRIKDYLDTEPLNINVETDLAEFAEMLDHAATSLDTDTILAESLQQAGNIVLAMPFLPGEPIGNPDEALPDYVSRHAFSDNNIIDDAQTNVDGIFPIAMVTAIPPVPEIGEYASGIGSLVALPDIDGGIRSEPLVVNYFDQFYPSMSMVLAAQSLNLDPAEIVVQLGAGVQLGRLKIRTDPYLLMNTFFYNTENGENAFVADSYYDVLVGNIPASKYRNKIVLIGATAYGVGDSMVTPIDPAMSPVMTLAHSVSSILNEDFFIQPEWATMAQLGIVLLAALYLMFLLPRLNAAVGFIISAVLIASMFIAHFVLMTENGLWVEFMMPIFLLGAGHLLLTTKNFLTAERGKARLDIESAESNRMLGLSMQGQGQLDMAFEKFRKLPPEDDTLELLYNLALDYERKRQFNKASSVYEYIKKHNKNFRDISDRTERAKKLEETVILGGGGGSSPGGTVLLDGGGVEKPMLGRYEVEKELGKGAMGAVYLGKDPKISRVVAIKTMALSQEFEEDELQDVKERFFREAETAGRLSHPSIVTIFDAGEEHDLAYIAMEFLPGSDLVKYSKKENLLPLETVLDLITRSADGLNYAHTLNVVHRDIKPANIMYDAASNSLKITDFGIARITDSSKTKTGMVLGTPSYMSPEQLSGKKVDGRSDLFSLGVMLYQMVTGQLPFTGDSMATLMYKIANEEHPSPDTIVPELPRCVTIIINKALAKEAEKRYQTGETMATDLRKCMQLIEKSA